MKENYLTSLKTLSVHFAIMIHSEYLGETAAGLFCLFSNRFYMQDICRITSKHRQIQRQLDNFQETMPLAGAFPIC